MQSDLLVRLHSERGNTVLILEIEECDECHRVISQQIYNSLSGYPAMSLERLSALGCEFCRCRETPARALASSEAAH